MRNFMLGAVSALALTGVAAVLTLPVGPLEAASSETYRRLDLFGDVLEKVRSDYVDTVNEGELIESAINGMLASLDPHSQYLNPKSFREMQVQTRGEFGGLGIEVTMENGLVKVVAPIDDTPASRAGLLPGDLIAGIDGKPVMGLTLQEAVEKMRGAVGSRILLTIRRKNVEKPFDVTLARDTIKVQSVRSRREGNAAYIRITTFNEQTSGGLGRAVDKLRSEIGADKIEGYVIDLRNNPGGLLDQAVSVSDAFLNQGEIVSTRGRKQDEGTRFNSKRGDITDGKPVVVLINGGSASASEIVAGALQDHKRAVVIGTKSFGKGSVQTIIPLQGQGALKLTTQRYYTPSGRSIQAVGIEPDVEVHQVKAEGADQATRRGEADLRNHLSGDPSKPEEDGKPAAPLEAGPIPTDLQSDPQLQRALELLRSGPQLGARSAPATK
ncbi:S41 family peptidase [Desertibaculum subflavum]|uniref:S41 family peptidase n=1 Tax=Desertibaculum subflavum TaxID=2268458 RepID=UPI0034D179CD